MRVAIIGRAGVGKSTIAEMMRGSNHTVYHCDEIVHRAYDKSKIVRGYITRNFGAHIISARTGKVNMAMVREILEKHPKLRTKLEDFLYLHVFAPLLKDKKDIIVDGILPRFIEKGKFDLILYAYINEDERIRRLLGRGVTQKQIAQIDSMQEDWEMQLFVAPAMLKKWGNIA